MCVHTCVSCIYLWKKYNLPSYNAADQTVCRVHNILKGVLHAISEWRDRWGKILLEKQLLLVVKKHRRFEAGHSLRMHIRSMSLCSLKTIWKLTFMCGKADEVGTFGVRDKSVMLGEVFYFTFPQLFLPCSCKATQCCPMYHSHSFYTSGQAHISCSSQVTKVTWFPFLCLLPCSSYSSWSLRPCSWKPFWSGSNWNQFTGSGW